MSVKPNKIMCMKEPIILSKRIQIITNKAYHNKLINNFQMKAILLIVSFLTIPLLGFCQCEKYVEKTTDRFDDKPSFKSIKLEGDGLTFDVKLEKFVNYSIFGEYQIDFQTNGHIMSTFWNVEALIFLFEDNSKFTRLKSNLEIIRVADNNNANSNQARHFSCSLISSSSYLDYESLTKINNETLNQFKHKALIAIRFKTSEGQIDIDLTKEQSIYFIEVFKCLGV